uniref:SH2 domain-containing protein n=1 Tax=Setaria digitata TaxID=48799 RepID=A0A915PRJ1_9BILA
MPPYDIPRPSQETILRLECWYHGLLTRLRAECLVRSEGDFLVRDSISFKGDFVLTVFWNGRAVHFQINKDPSSLSASGFFFQFEEEQFENVSDLITFYQAHQKPITRNSGCIIKNPVPNTATSTADGLKLKPEIEQNYMRIIRPNLFKFNQELSLSQKVLLNETRKQLQLRRTPTPQVPSSTSPVAPDGKAHLSLSDLLSRPLPRPLQSPVHNDEDEVKYSYSEMDYDAMEEATIATAKEISTVQKHEVMDDISTSTSSLSNKLPVVSLNSTDNDLIASGPVLLSPTTSASCIDISKLHWRIPRSSSFPALPERKVSFPIRDSGCVVDNSDYDQPRPSTTAVTNTVIDLLNYRSPFIEPSNKPQMQRLLEKFRELLLAKKPESCAGLITVEDCRLLRLEQNLQDVAKCERINGLSLVLLPHGENVRNDLLERSRSLYYLCVLSILHQTQRTQRCVVYGTWIRIAWALFYQFGNAFSFLTLIDALCSDLVKCTPTDECLWKMQRELEVLAGKLQRGEPLPENSPKMNIPFMQPVIKILSNNPSCNNDWATELDDLWKWLQQGRNWVKEPVHLKLYSETISHSDNFLSTEFSLKLLFGSKDYSMDTEKRYIKLAAMANTLQKRCSLSS